MSKIIDSYLAWFDQLPSDLKEEVSIFMVVLIPDHPLKGTMSQPSFVSRFTAWINGSATSAPESLGLALVLIAVTEFVFVQERGTEEDWVVRWNRLDILRERAAQDGQPGEANRLEKRMEHAAEISRSWIDAAQRFQKLRTSSLSYDSLRASLKRAA